MGKVDYKVVCVSISQYREEWEIPRIIEQSVSKLIEQGYLPIGGLSIVMDKRGDFFAVQSMTKETT